MQISKTRSKNTNKAPSQQPQLNTQVIKWELYKKLVREYSTSQGYFYTKIIEDLVEKKQSDKNCITANDMKFNDQKEYMEKYYKRNESCQEFPQLLQYYKYYSQDSICFLNRQFYFLSVHHDKKKAVLYQQLKKQLNISDSKETIQQVTRVKTHQKFDNVLSDLEFTFVNDQSYLVAEVLKKLINHYGPSRTKTINKIDSEFKFMTHNLAIGKSKASGKQGPSLFNPQTMLQSTNTSVRNNCYLKSKNTNNSKNTTHRRFGSCQVAKSPTLKSLNSVSGKQKKNARARRRKSAQLISSANVNLGICNEYKKNAVKTEQHNKTTKMNEVNFKEKMEQLRNKIRRQKQNLNKKSGTLSTNKKKSRK